MTKELPILWNEAKRYAMTHNLKSHAQDFASYVVVTKLTSPKRSLWLSSLLVDYKRKEFGDLRYDVGKSRKRLAKQFYELVVMDKTTAEDVRYEKENETNLGCEV
jgi:hypothetical protein